MQFRAHDWMDTKEMKMMYGVQGLTEDRWAHCHTKGVPLLFDTKEERDQWIKDRTVKQLAGG